MGRYGKPTQHQSVMRQRRAMRKYRATEWRVTFARWKAVGRAITEQKEQDA